MIFGLRRAKMLGRFFAQLVSKIFSLCGRLYSSCVRSSMLWILQETFTHSHSSWSSIIPICFLHLLPSTASSIFNPRALQSFTTISLQVFFGLPLGLAPSTSYISSPNHYLLFATHAHTIATCFAVVLRLCHLNLVCLSTLYPDFYLVTSHNTSILPFSSLPSEVPPHFPFYRPRLTSMEHTASHTTAVQSPSQCQ